jgi:hypothetical protein
MDGEETTEESIDEADEAEESSDEEEANEKIAQQEKAHIGLAETVMVVLAAFVGDLVEMFIPYVGAFFGLLVSALIFLWTLMRGMGNHFYLKKLVINSSGLVLDTAVTFAGPALLLLFYYLLNFIRTLTVIITIWLNNKFTKKEIGKIKNVLGKALIK